MTRTMIPALAALFALATLATRAAAQPLVIAADTAPRATSMPLACTPQVFGGHTYFFCHLDADQPTARAFCRSFGTEMASISNRYENDLVAGFVQSLGRGRHWIGYTDTEREGTFISDDGSPVTFTGWLAGEPNNQNEEDCTELDATGFWNDVPCANVHPNVVCEETSACTTEVFRDHVYQFCARAAPPASSCAQYGSALAVINDDAERAFVAAHAGHLAPRAEFVCEDPAPCLRRYYDHHTYLFCTRPDATARSAVQSCRGRGAALATLESAGEDAFVSSMMWTFRRAGFVLGMTDEGSEGSFHTLNREPILYSRWLPGEPNNAGGAENCVEMSALGWNDIPCEGHIAGAFVCEMP